MLDVLMLEGYTDSAPKYVVGKTVPPNVPQGAKYSFERVWLEQPCRKCLGSFGSGHCPASAVIMAQERVE